MNTYEQQAAKRMMQEDNDINLNVRKKIAFKKAKSICKDCGGSGHIDWNGSRYGCSHGLSYEERTFNGKVH